MEKNRNKTIGFLTSHKENEKRISLLPEDLAQVEYIDHLYLEKNYGRDLGIEDFEYEAYGCHIESREDILKKDILCEPKIGEADFLAQLQPHQAIFGWIHEQSNQSMMHHLLANNVTLIAWENMNDNQLHCFHRNNELAGEAAILHAYIEYGKLPYETDVAVIGRGNTAKGAIKILDKLGANVVIYNRHQEQLFHDELGNYDVIVNAILWDENREDHILCLQDLKRMRKGSMIIDVSCDYHGAIESSVPTTFCKPTYIIDNVIHYVVDHTPSILFRSASASISKEIVKYLDDLITGSANKILDNAQLKKG